MKRIFAAFVLAAVLFGIIRIYATDEKVSGTLPVLYIETEKTVDSKEEYVSGRMRIQTDEESPGDWMSLEIRGRGNSTWYQEKKPYKIKLDTAEGLLGMDKSRHWVLLANVFDASHLRNMLSYDLSGELGMYHIETKHVEVVLNGRYEGLYQLSESIRIEDGRVEIFDWDEFCEKAAKTFAKSLGEDEKTFESRLKTDLCWITSGFLDDIELPKNLIDENPDISGGYLLELDEYYDEISKFTTKNDVPIMIKSPEYACTNPEMMEYIQNYIKSFEDAVYSSDGYNNEGKHYSEYIDMESFVDYWIVNQFFKSVELLYKSCFMYKDVGKKLTFGPVWDMDWSSGNHKNLIDSSATFDEWKHSESQDRELWYRQLYDDPYFISLLENRYFEVRDKLVNCIESIDGWENKLKSAAEADGRRWGSEWSYEKECLELKTWLENRLLWMDEQLSKRDPKIMNMGFPRENKLSLTLTGETVEQIVTTEDDKLKSAPFDYSSAESKTITVVAILNSDFVKNYDVYVNGLYYISCDYLSNETPITLELSNLIPDDGNCVIRVIGRGTNGKTIYHDNYVTLKIENQPPSVVSETSDTEQTDSNTALAVMWLAICASAFVVLIVTVGFVKKRKHN